MRIRVLLLALFLFISRQSAAAVAVFPVDGTNLRPGQQEAIGQMIAAAYQIESREAVIPPKLAQRSLDETAGYAAAAQKLGATEYVLISAVRLQDRVAITASRYRPDGTLVFSVKLTATSLDDVEPLSERLARALFRQQSPKEVQNLENVTATEGKKPNRVFVEKVMGLKASFVYPIGYGDEIAPMMSFGFDGRLEGSSYFLEIGAGFLIPSGVDGKLSYGGLYSDIGASFYLTSTSASPYLGAGVLPRLVGREVTNFAAYGQAGVMFFRESSSRLYTDLRVAQNLMPVGFGSDFDSTGALQTSNKQLYPTELTFSVGIGW